MRRTSVTNLSNGSWSGYKATDSKNWEGNTLGKRVPFGNSSRFFDSVNGEIRYSGFHERHVDVDN